MSSGAAIENIAYGGWHDVADGLQGRLDLGLVGLVLKNSVQVGNHVLTQHTT